MTAIMEKDALAGAGLSPAIDRLTAAVIRTAGSYSTDLQRSFVLELITLLTRCRDTQEELVDEKARLRAGLQWYAEGSHFILSDDSEWDTVSGEPQNWYCDSFGTATIEDGSVAKAVLDGAVMTTDDHDVLFVLPDATGIQS